MWYLIIVVLAVLVFVDFASLCLALVWSAPAKAEQKEKEHGSNFIKQGL